MAILITHEIRPTRIPSFSKSVEELKEKIDTDVDLSIKNNNYSHKDFTYDKISNTEYAWDRVDNLAIYS